MLTSLLLLSHFAHATDIGTDKKLGLGVAFGDPYISFNMKYWLNEKSGLTANIGTNIFYSEVRVGYESNIHTFGEDWGFAQLPLYWFGAVDVGLYTPGFRAYPRFGVGGGAGVALQFEDVPAEVFATAGLSVGYTGGCSDVYGGFAPITCIVQPIGQLGGRWYF